MRESVGSTAVLVLEDGTRYEGNAYGARGRTLGEAVFATGMTGYQETLTDPSYAGQIVLMTAPHIGNTGVNDEDRESDRIWVAGFIVREPSRVVSNYRATGSLGDALVGAEHRRHQRHRHAGHHPQAPLRGRDARWHLLGRGCRPRRIDAARARARLRRDGRRQPLRRRVGRRSRTSLPADGERIGSVAVLDLGVKSSTLHYLAARGLRRARRFRRT